MTEKERAEQLAAAHWGYVKGLLAVHCIEGDFADIVGFHYRTAMAHGYGHGVEDERNRMFAEIPLPGSARYEEIHAELTEGEVAKFASYPEVCRTCNRTFCGLSYKPDAVDKCSYREACP